MANSAIANLGRCELCGERMASLDLNEHLRLLHPAEYGTGPDAWPDGGAVIIDMTDLEGP